MLWILLPLVCALSLVAGAALQSRRQVSYKKRWREAVALVEDVRGQAETMTDAQVGVAQAAAARARAERDEALSALREAVDLREAAVDARDSMQLDYDEMRREYDAMGRGRRADTDAG